jgi:hypothetical protein
MPFMKAITDVTACPLGEEEMAICKLLRKSSLKEGAM